MFNNTLANISRTGTKVALISLIISGAISAVVLIWVVFVLPILALKYPSMIAVIQALNVPGIIVGLNGGPAVMTAVGQIRVAMENSAGVVRTKPEETK